MNTRTVTIVVIAVAIVLVAGIIWWVLSQNAGRQVLTPPPLTLPSGAEEQVSFGSEISEQVQNPASNLPTTNPFGEVETNPLERTQTNPFEYKNPFE